MRFSNASMETRLQVVPRALKAGMVPPAVLSKHWSGRRESNPHHPLGKLTFRSFICNTYKIANRSAKMYTHELHTAHALPDLLAGRFWLTVLDRFRD